MGIDAGFDMVPQLTQGVVDQMNWSKFLDVIKKGYEDDELVEMKPNYILFKVGEWPKIPFEGHKFLRFSSKVSGSIAKASRVKDYIDTVSTVAYCSFGSRVRNWNEARDERGFYSWHDVHESWRSFEQVDEPSIPNTIAGFVFGRDTLKELGLPLYEVRSIPGKGRGLVARFAIPKGALIVSEEPLLITGSFPPDVLERRVASQLKSLSRDDQRRFLSLHNNFPGKYPFGGTVKTNALPCGSGSHIGGIYPTICLINHSCAPNANNNWNDDEGYETIHAIRHIPSGEEITISYSGGPSSVRRPKLRRAFGFDCDCRICSLPVDELVASDDRRREIERLDTVIGDPRRMFSDPKSGLADCRLLLDVLQKEFHGAASPHAGRLYYDAFQISVAHADQARAAVFAERAYKARLTCEGPDSPLTKKVRSLGQNPSGYGGYGHCSMHWKSKREDMPRGLDAAQFEDWLWRAD